MGAGAVREVVDTAAEWENLGKRISNFAADAEEARAIQDRLFETAQKTGTEFGAVVETFARLAPAARDLGLGIGDSAIQIIETLNQIVATSGASTQEASNALRQLSQAFATGVLRGDELRSVSEQLPGLLAVVAADSGKTTSQVIADARENGLAITEVIAALQNQQDAIGANFAKMGDTIERSQQRVSNAFTKMVGDAAAASGASKQLGAAITAFGELLASPGLQQAAAALFGELAREIKLTIQILETLGGAASASVEGVTSAINFVVEGFREAEQAIGQAVTSINESVAGLGSGINEALGQDLQSAVESSAGATTGIANQWLELYNYLYGRSVVPELVEGIGSEFGRLPALVGAPVQATGGIVTAAFDEMAAAADALRGLGADLPMAQLFMQPGRPTAAAPFAAPQPGRAMGVLPAPIAGAAPPIIMPSPPRPSRVEIAATVGPRQATGIDASAHTTDLDALRQAGQAAAEATRQVTDEQTRLGDATLETAGQFQTAMEAARIFARTTSSGIVDAISAGDSLGETFTNITRSIVEAIAEMLIFQALMASIGGPATAAGPATGLFGLFGRQHGGPVHRRQPYIVGEAGPELFVPDASGMVVPGRMAAGSAAAGGPRVAVTVINNANAKVETRESQDEQGQPRIDILIDEMVANNMRPGTSTSRALRDRFGLQFQTRR